MSNCFQKIKQHVKEAGLDIPESRLKEYSYLLDQSRADLLTKAEFAKTVSDMIEEDGKRFAEKKQAANLITLATREAAVEGISRNIEKLGAPESMRAWIEGGSLKPGIASNLDPAKMKNDVLAHVFNFWQNAIGDLREFTRNGALNKEVYQELWALQKDGRVGESGSKEALGVARAIQATQDLLFDLKKSYTPFMEKADEYLIKRFHDRTKVSGVEKDQWVQDAMEAFGKRSFPELSPTEKADVFGGIYERIRDGSFGSLSDDASSAEFIRTKGVGGDIARRMARGRQLVANDWSSAYQYNLKYGYDTLEATMMKVMQGSSRDVALLQKFGPVPQDAYDQVFNRIYQKSSPEVREQLTAAKPQLDRSFKTATGTADAPASGIQARIAQGALSAEYLSKTGGALARSLPDINLAASLMKDLNGKTLGQNAAEIAMAYAKSLASSEHRQKLLGGAGLFSQSVYKELLRDVSSVDQKPGVMGKIIEGYGKLTLLSQHIDAMRGATGMVLTHGLADIAENAHTDLSPNWKQGLARYGIGEPEWNAIRQGVLETEGQKYLAPEGVRGLPDSVIEDYLGETDRVQGEGDIPKDVINHARYDLSYKLGAMINEHADLSSAHPGSRQRTFLYQGTSINEPLGQLLRFIGQFKSAAITTADIYRRSYYSSGTLRGAWTGVATRMATGMFFWTLGQYLSELAAGKTPEDPTSPSFVAKMMAGSGAAGIFGDILVNEASKHTVSDVAQGMLKSLAGPVLGDAATVAGIGVKGAMAAGGDRTNKAPSLDIAKFGLGLVPSQNLLWTKAAFNYYLADGIKEFMHPGYLSQLERGVAKTPGLLDNRQKYFMFRPLEAPRW